jgi:uncharacterized protein YndB with AHSA1/START domain
MTTQSYFSISRAIDAPRERVFRAWTEPQLVSRWFRPDDGWSAPLDLIEMDVTPGGTWRVTMIDETGEEYPATFVYREIDAPARIVFTTGGPDDDPDDPLTPVAIVTLSVAGDHTAMTFEGSAPAAEVDDIEQGWSFMLDRLADQVSHSGGNAGGMRPG